MCLVVLLHQKGSLSIFRWVNFIFHLTTVVGIFIFKEGKKNRVIIEGPYKIQKTDNPSEDIEKNTSFFIKRIENFVSQYPSQWFTWLHRIFR